MYRLLSGFADRGGAALVLSRETIELIGLCDRLYVIQGGTAVAEFEGGQVTEHEILDAALRHARKNEHTDDAIDPVAPPQPRGLRALLSARMGRNGAWPVPVALLLLGLGWLSMTYAEFRSAEGLSNFLTQATPLLLVAIGQMVVVLVRGLDLSVPSVVGLTTVILASGGSPPVLIVGAIVCGAADRARQRTHHHQARCPPDHRDLGHAVDAPGRRPVDSPYSGR